MINTVSPMKKFLRNCGKRWQLFLFLLPAVVYILIFAYYPMFGVQIAFRNYQPRGGIWNSPWVGLKHFEKFFKSYQFGRVLTNTLAISFYSLLMNFPLSIIMALCINTVRNAKFKKMVQTITYMPHFISVVVMVGVLIRFFNPTLGVLSKMIQSLGGTDRDLMGVPSAIPHLYVWSGIWQNAGWSTILYLSALTAVDPQLHEAAIVDGATRMHRVWHIDVPTIVPVIVISLIMNCGSILSVGTEKMLLMQNSLNRSTTEVIATYVYNQGIAAGSPKYSYATAIGLMNSVISFILIVTVNGICKKLNETSLF